VCDVAGLAVAKTGLPFEKRLRDLITLTGLMEPDLKLVRDITIPVVETYIDQNGPLMKKLKEFTFSKMLLGDRKKQFDNPDLVHFIAEHAHPSLEPAARHLEVSMSRVDKLVDKLVSDEGVFLREDYVALRDLALVLENNLAMIASIARASRSYSIGLRNSDYEIAWTIWFCTKAAKRSEVVMRDVMDDYDILKLNPSTTAIGKSVLDSRGYCIESPLEKNW